MSSNELVEQIMAQVIARVGNAGTTGHPLVNPNLYERRLWQKKAAV